MKKYIFIAVACLSIAACTKEASGGKDDPDIPGTSFTKGQKVTLTVSAGDQTKVTSSLNKTSGAIDFEWEAGDQVKVIVNEGQTGESSTTFTMKSISDDRKTASFEGVMPSGGTTFSIQYPVTVPTITTQTYSSTEAIPHDMMLLKATGCTVSGNKSLTARNAVLRLNLYGEKKIGKIEVIKGSDTYTLNCSSAVTIGTATSTAIPFFIVVPAGSYNFTVNFYDENNALICSSTTTSTPTFTAGKVKNTNPKAMGVVFSVSDDKTVKFTSGNLWYGTTTLAKETVTSGWHLESSQTAYPTSWSTSHVSHFFWSNTTDWQTSGKEPYAEIYSYSSRSGTDKFWCGEDNKLPVDGQSGLYALSKDEWTYLLNTTGSSGRTDANRFAKARVNNVKGLIIFPDGYNSGTAISGVTGVATVNTADASFPTKDNVTDWSSMEAKGCVFLPGAGYRSGSKLISIDDNGYFWSSTPCKDDAYRFRYGDSDVNPGLDGTRNSGYSIRLVATVSAE